MDLHSHQDLRVLKKLLCLMLEYTDKLPKTKVEDTFNKLCEFGIKAIPQDTEYLTLLEKILDGSKNPTAKVQEILNLKYKNKKLIEYLKLVKE